MYTGMSVYICLHVCTYAHMYVYINICTHTRTRVHTHAYRYVKTIRRGCMVFSLRVSVFFSGVTHMETSNESSLFTLKGY